MIPVKHDMAGVIKLTWLESFSIKTIAASFAGAGIYPVDMMRGINRLSGRGTKRKEGTFGRPPLEDLPMVVTDKDIADSLGRRAKRQLHTAAHPTTGLRINTVFFGECTKKERVAPPAIIRSQQGVT